MRVDRSKEIEPYMIYCATKWKVGSNQTCYVRAIVASSSSRAPLAALMRF